MRSRNSIVIVVALFAGSASADLLWDNNRVPDGFSGRAMSPPGFPDIRIADDFTIRGSFVIEDFHANVIHDDGWRDGGDITLEIRADTDGSGPGGIVATHTRHSKRARDGRPWAEQPRPASSHQRHRDRFPQDGYQSRRSGGTGHGASTEARP